MQTYQASRGLSAIAELLVYIGLWVNKLDVTTIEKFQSKIKILTKGMHDNFDYRGQTKTVSASELLTAILWLSQWTSVPSSPYLDSSDAIFWLTLEYILAYAHTR